MSDPRRQELLAQRETALCSLAALEAPAAGQGDDGDLALVAEQREWHARRQQSLRARLRALDVALERLAGGVFGICEGCGGEISAPRLRVIPDAARCLECQVQIEQTEAAHHARDRRPSPHEDEDPSALPS